MPDQRGFLRERREIAINSGRSVKSGVNPCEATYMIIDHTRIIVTLWLHLTALGETHGRSIPKKATLWLSILTH
jgi:hypothetical protein